MALAVKSEEDLDGALAFFGVPRSASRMSVISPRGVILKENSEPSSFLNLAASLDSTPRGASSLFESYWISLLDVLFWYWIRLKTRVNWAARSAATWSTTKVISVVVRADSWVFSPSAVLLTVWSRVNV